MGKSIYGWGDTPIPVVGVFEHLVRPSMQCGPSARDYSLILPIRATWDFGGQYVLRTSPDRRQEVLKSAS